MPLPTFTATEVQPGQPLTAQAWNEIVQALAALNAHLQAAEETSLRVQIANAGIDLSRVRITAVSQDGLQAFAGVRTADTAGQGQFIFSGLRPGVFTVRAEAPAFDAVSQAVTVPSAQPVSLTLTARGAAMPALFGAPLGDALQILSQTGIAVGRIVDAQGREVAPANPGADAVGVPVLMQLPAPGEPVPVGTLVQLAIAAPLRVEATVEVPSLAGLSLEEAKKALEALGLKLGKTENRQRRINT
ncbi:MAG TPA: PASTA domain-containing protein [Thermoanaerobaculia bacterium]|nr:PASTA domain-containing protein [Thermoanaerobaculia bacterium]